MCGSFSTYMTSIKIRIIKIYLNYTYACACLCVRVCSERIPRSRPVNQLLYYHNTVRVLRTRAHVRFSQRIETKDVADGKREHAYRYTAIERINNNVYIIIVVVVFVKSKPRSNHTNPRYLLLTAGIL